MRSGCMQRGRFCLPIVLLISSQRKMNATSVMSTLPNKTCPSEDPSACERYENFLHTGDFKNHSLIHAGICVPHDSPNYNASVPCERFAFGPPWLWVHGGSGKYGWRTPAVHHMAHVEKFWSQSGEGSHAGEPGASPGGTRPLRLSLQSLTLPAHLSHVHHLLCNATAFVCQHAHFPHTAVPPCPCSGQMAWLLARKVIDPRVLTLPMREALLIQVRTLQLPAHAPITATGPLWGCGRAAARTRRSWCHRWRCQPVKGTSSQAYSAPT